MKIITGNDLGSGDVVWWAGQGWSRRVADAADVGENGPAIIAIEEAALRVNAAYVLEAEFAAGAIRPAHIKDRVRAYGPSVRLDLAIDPQAAVRVAERI